MEVSFLQINNSFAGQNYLPYSAALLTSYFNAYSSAAGEYNFKPFIYKRDSVNNLLSICEGSGIIALSLYAWNTRLSLAFAKAYKNLFPESFTFYSPQNLIGGDLIWTQKCKFGKIIAVVDCMGHGVPGAMLAMSVMSGISNTLRRVGGLPYLYKVRSFYFLC